MKKLLACVREYKLPSLLSPVMVTAEVIVDILIPYMMSRIIDIGIPNRDIGYVVRTGLVMIALAMAGLLFGALAGRFAAKAAMGFGKNLRQAMYYRIQDFSFGNMDQFSTASLVTRLTTDVTNVQNAYMMVIRGAVRSPIMLVCALFMTIRINRELSAVFLIAVPLLGVALFFIVSKAHPRFRAMLAKYDALNAGIEESLIAIRVVKAFVRHEYEDEKFEKSAADLRDAQKRAEKIVIFNMPLMQITMYACITAILWFGGRKIIVGGMQAGELISFISYVSQILMALMMLSMIFVLIVISRASVQRIEEVLATVPDLDDSRADPKAAPQDGSIRFEDVTFSYSHKAENPTLSHIDLDIRSGETIGIIGGTGSAKSTLVQLIPRLYDTDSGRVTVGGRDVRDYPLHTLRNSVAMVLQKNVLFSGTIADNLRWGNDRATDAELREACRVAAADEFVDSQPDGYDTDLGQGGVNVSGGQKQRLCIARALLKKPKIMILDDSTSAVDTATDSRIRSALRSELSGMTVLIIAQRIASVMDADRIVVLDDGKIAAVGTHAELMKTSEIYREVYESQQKGVA